VIFAGRQAKSACAIQEHTSPQRKQGTGKNALLALRAGVAESRTVM
jgi:hypothetical protein